MEVLFVSHKFPPATGGMEKQSYELIMGMAKYCKVHLIVYDGQGSVLRFFGSLQKRIVNLCRENPGIEIIHFNDGLLAAFCLWHKGYPGLKRTVTLHGLDVVFPSKIYHRYILPRFSRFNKLIAVSQATAEKIIDLGIRRERVEVIKNGVDTHMQKPILKRENMDAGGKRILVMMGRPVIRKGISWFISQVLPFLEGNFLVLIIGPFDHKQSVTESLLSTLPKRIRNKIMLFLGYPSDQGTIRKLLKDPKYKDSIKHLGRLPLDEVQEILAASDVFLMPNIKVDGDMEGFGLVCLEAAVLGAVVFASDIDGIPDAIQHQKNGFLVASERPDVWGKKLNHLIENPGEYKKYSNDFSKYTVENYSWEKMVESYYQLFLSL
ncbi:glycosyltransferase family 4 protein [Pedobacter metabolipauper]|uniref:Glycosyltransferase involved in cell wall biosynthesis n=1 Tax=Pedobacter metabolipauper TaxID=425513 RepID=A0A4R6SVU4_9SPHI|nr:glycosyltransferase family 4 protein [Pedobacter metabolipauper]TDQ10018.1 glycosyltransferase involved in cell wall biosynthesis [Pedobacter metabolipauper]